MFCRNSCLSIVRLGSLVISGPITSPSTSFEQIRTGGNSSLVALDASVVQHYEARLRDCGLMSCGRSDDWRSSGPLPYRGSLSMWLVEPIDVMAKWCLLQVGPKKDMDENVSRSSESGDVLAALAVQGNVCSIDIDASSNKVRLKKPLPRKKLIPYHGLSNFFHVTSTLVLKQKGTSIG